MRPCIKIQAKKLDLNWQYSFILLIMVADIIRGLVGKDFFYIL